MASSEQLKALLMSHLAGDDERFLSIALQVAAHEARIGHGKLAVELRDIVDKAKKRAKSAVPVSIAKGLKDASGLLYATTPQVRLGDLVTTDEVRDKLSRVIREQRHVGKLKSHGLSPRRKLLLVGPPGTGKTFTASVLAGERLVARVDLKAHRKEGRLEVKSLHLEPGVPEEKAARAADQALERYARDVELALN